MSVRVVAYAPRRVRLARTRSGKIDRLRQICEYPVVDDPNRRIVVHLDRVHPLVAERLGVLDRRAQIPRGTDSRVHATGVTREQPLDRVVQLLLIVEAGLTAEIKIGVAAAPDGAVPEDPPHVAEPLWLRHVRRRGRSGLTTAAALRRKPGAARLAGNLDALRRRVVLEILPQRRDASLAVVGERSLVVHQARHAEDGR